MSDIDKIVEFMTAPPTPAMEVVSLERATVENILGELEGNNPLRPVVTYLRARLADPKVELWAMHNVGPGEVYPCLNREDAERQAQQLRDLGEQLKAARIAKGECVAAWSDWVANVVPSPWEPDEHFEIMAEEWQSNYRELADQTSKLQAELEELRRDAERYRWLRSRDLETISQGGVFVGTTPANLVINEETLDEHVDYAMAKEARP